MSDETPDNEKKLSESNQAIWDDYLERQDRAASKTMPPEENFEKLLAEHEAGNEAENKSGSQGKLDEIQPSSVLPATQKNKKSPAQPPQLDRRTEDKLRKGKIDIERKLDLHGLNKSQAYEALTGFITKSFNEKCRCVLVVTGKGKSKTSEGWLEEGQGVLKQNVPQWLATPPLNENVLKVMPAQPKHGGAGALYVYLKRHRN